MMLLSFIVLLILINYVLTKQSNYNTVDYSCLHTNSSISNSIQHFNDYFGSFTNTTIKYDNINNSIIWYFTAIANYDKKFTYEEINNLNNRPNAENDFVNGKTIAAVDEFIIWGQNIGYNVVTGCNLGYWPPGPDCPKTNNNNISFTLEPRQEISQSGCWIGLDSIGLLSNGVSMFGWGDGKSANNESTWFQLAPIFEFYDMDICFGHAARGNYHHHNFPNCLGEKLSDKGETHSPIYGFAADGFPIYGPFQDKNTLAVSCWKLRDYSSSSKTGCSSNGRTCILKNEYDYTEGIINVTHPGPLFTSQVQTQSGNTISAKNGVYYEDYYYDISCSLSGNEYLNEFNGHDHDDFGFHYHFTIDETFLPIFPFTIGPKFYGSVPENFHCCPSFLDAVAMGLHNSEAPPPCTQPPCPQPSPPCTQPPCPQPTLGCIGKSIGSENTYGVPKEDAKCLF